MGYALQSKSLEASYTLHTFKEIFMKYLIIINSIITKSRFSNSILNWILIKFSSCNV